MIDFDYLYINDLIHILNSSVIEKKNNNETMYSDRGLLCSFQHHLQHRPHRPKRNTEIQLWQWVHRQVYCDKVSIVVKRYNGISRLRFDQLATAFPSTPP